MAVLSIAHRASGILLFLAIPLLIHFLSLSLRDEAGFRAATAMLQTLPGQLVVAALVWSLVHHFLAGLRFLLLDMDIGVDRAPARLSAWTVNLVAIALTLVVLAGLA